MTESLLSRLFWPVALITVATMAALSFQFGITTDEYTQQRYGELLWSYYRSAFVDRSALEYRDLYLYGGLFELTCAAAERLSPFFAYDTRHLVNSVVGGVGIVYAARLATRLGGIRAGFLALMFLLLSPVYFAHCMNNPKDIPFATACVSALYYLSEVEPRYPFLSISTAAKITLAIAAAINIRAAGLLLVFYFVVRMTAGVLLDSAAREPRRLIIVGATMMAMVVASVLLGTVFWPWALQRPFVRPFEALRVLGHFPNPVPVVFAGAAMRATDIPRSYALTMLAITTPLPVLAGAAAAFACWLQIPRERRLAYAIVCLSVVFPLVTVMLARSPLYDGVRHLLFLYPSLVVLSAVSWSLASTGLQRHRVLRWLLLGGAALAMLDPIFFHLRNHPNQNSYFNWFVGGPRGAFERYDMDYWGNCEKQAVAWVRSRAHGTDERIRVSATDRYLKKGVQADVERFDDLVYVKERSDADFHIEVLRQKPGIIARRLREGGIVHTVSVDGVPLCLVKKGGAGAAR